jgi:hypothetical protein
MFDIQFSNFLKEKWQISEKLDMKNDRNNYDERNFSMNEKTVLLQITNPLQHSYVRFHLIKIQYIN